MTPNILLIYTGGTIGMVADTSTGALQNLDFKYISAQIPEISLLNVIVTPKSISTPMDSSHMDPSIWVELCQMIEASHADYDGIVILHGTDTMAYTSSALSFMIQNLQKPIVFTGSQLPVGILRSDGKENLLTALEIAGKRDKDGTPSLKEVSVFFQSKLFRGNRISKVSTQQFDAFDSPNFPLLGHAGVQIEVFHNNLLPIAPSDPTFSPSLEPRVGVVKLFPGMRIKAYASIFCVKHHLAVVLETFGAGNSPKDEAFEQVLSDYVNSGGILVTVSQCTRGSVQPAAYASGHFLEHLGSWNGKDLTTEAAITKLMWVLANNFGNAKLRFEEAVCGEIS